MTKLGDTLGGGPARTPAQTASRFMAALSGKRPTRDITVPLLELPAQIILLGTTRENEIESDVLRVMAERGIEQTMLSTSNYELERAVRHLADAVREPGPVTATTEPAALGTIDEWGRLPPAVVADLYMAYNDLAEEHDPARYGLSAEERIAITAAVEKKSAAALRYFGVRRLALWLTTTDVLLAHSPTEKSEPGDSSLDL